MKGGGGVYVRGLAAGWAGSTAGGGAEGGVEAGGSSTAGGAAVRMRRRSRTASTCVGGDVSRCGGGAK